MVIHVVLFLKLPHNHILYFPDNFQIFSVSQFTFRATYKILVFNFWAKSNVKFFFNFVALNFKVLKFSITFNSLKTYLIPKHVANNSRIPLSTYQVVHTMLDAEDVCQNITRVTGEFTHLTHILCILRGILISKLSDVLQAYQK